MAKVDVLTAVIRYEVAARKVSALTRQIGEALNECPINKKVSQEWGNEDLSHLLDGARTKTHLYLAFKETIPCDSGYGSRGLQDDEIDEYLDGEDGCDGCRKAWIYVCERKAARREFGIAKRAIRTIGKHAVDTMTGGSGEG